MFVRRLNLDRNPMPGHSRSGQFVEILAPAKINLFLEILGKRDDGFHDLDMVMTSVGLYDTLSFSESADQQIQLTCKWESTGCMNWQPEEIPSTQENLVYQAALALRNHARAIGKPTTGVEVTLLKRIPTRAGLGGGSSDAAATLIGLSYLWGLSLETQQLIDIAAELGSDVPYFIRGGVARCQSRGEQITHVEDHCHLNIVLAQADSGLSTPDVFAGCEVPESPSRIQPMVDAVSSGDPARVSSQLHNRLYVPASRLAPSVRGIEKTMMDAGCLAATMTGSGTAVFGICRNATQARRIAGLLRSRQIGWVRATSTIPVTNYLPFLAS